MLFAQNIRLAKWTVFEKMDHLGARLVDFQLALFFVYLPQLDVTGRLQEYHTVGLSEKSL